MRGVHWFHQKYLHNSDCILLLYNVLEHNKLFIVYIIYRQLVRGGGGVTGCFHGDKPQFALEMLYQSTL